MHKCKCGTVIEDKYVMCAECFHADKANAKFAGMGYGHATYKSGYTDSFRNLFVKYMLGKKK